MDGTVQCGLCPKACIIEAGQSGACRIRVNIDGKLTAVTYGFPCSAHLDPVEKKPLFHFLPGTSILSLATVGCTLHCKNCQNWEISQRNPEESTAMKLPPKAVPQLAKAHGCQSVAYTYTDPAAYYEYALDSSIKVREAGLKNVLVTAAYINKAPWRELCRHTDAANIDLKSMSDTFYRDICEGTLQPVLNALVLALECGVLVEVTNLLIPTLNDSDGELLKLARWVKQNMGAETPLHFSRFFPHYRMRNLPPTPPETLDRAKQIAESEGLKHVYIGNILSKRGENTYCPGCGKLLIERNRYTILKNELKNGKCGSCGTEIKGVWQ
ncbi:MAG: AmmeMemoRadiSam system radical SAM enzyme [Kiritimatiellales bacterium]|nr:AmmeMemoRadiSam system radical SAM enzyme [Kiritimatiellales bacterium]